MSANPSAALACFSFRAPSLGGSGGDLGRLRLRLSRIASSKCPEADSFVHALRRARCPEARDGRPSAVAGLPGVARPTWDDASGAGVLTLPTIACPLRRR